MGPRRCRLEAGLEVPPGTWAPRVRFKEKFRSKQVLKCVLAPRHLLREIWQE